ncbi:MAG: preprotein translocase subunit SecG [Candidatus Dormibacteria bacterium]
MKVGFAIAQDVLGVLVMLGVLLQTPKATGLGGTIGGGGDSGGGYRRRRGLEATLLRASVILIVLFVGVSVVQTYVGGH